MTIRRPRKTKFTAKSEIRSSCGDELHICDALLLLPLIVVNQLQHSSALQSTMPSEEELNMFFKKFDKGDKGYIESTQIASILKIMGVQFNTAQLRQLITEFDDDGSGTFEFEEFSALVNSVEEDEGASEEELREIFRLFDKAGDGFITTDVLRGILAAIDDNLTSDDLDQAINEIDEDGSGTVDFDEFKQMMNG